MKIKIIDLLNMVANFEEMPEKIKHQYYDYSWNRVDKDYQKSDGDLLFRNMKITYHLNDEVEIIEEEKEIEKIRMNGNCFFSESIEAWINKEKSSAYCEFLSNKINELVDEINKLKKEK